jgi:glutamate--cysteine ligase catalytic subunit
MGCCCLQVTKQCKSEAESRFLNDQLAILAPIFQALSAATPILKGQLAGTDTRWEVISQAVDDRTSAEDGSTSSDAAAAAAQRDPRLVGGGVARLAKSRYSSVSAFLGQRGGASEAAKLRRLNDVPVDFDQEAYSLLTTAGVDEALALHIAHLFVRDPLVIFDDAIALDNTQSMVKRSFA